MTPEQSVSIGWGHDLITCTLEFISRLTDVSIDRTEFSLLNAVVLTYPGMMFDSITIICMSITDYVRSRREGNAFSFYVRLSTVRRFYSYDALGQPGRRAQSPALPRAKVRWDSPHPSPRQGWVWNPVPLQTGGIGMGRHGHRMLTESLFIRSKIRSEKEIVPFCWSSLIISGTVENIGNLFFAKYGLSFSLFTSLIFPYSRCCRRKGQRICDEITVQDSRLPSKILFEHVSNGTSSLWTHVAKVTGTSHH